MLTDGSLAHSGLVKGPFSLGPGPSPFGPIRAHMGPYGPIWAHMDPIWAHMGPYTRKFPKIPRKFLGIPRDLCGDLCGDLCWTDMLSLRHESQPGRQDHLHIKDTETTYNLAFREFSRPWIHYSTTPLNKNFEFLGFGPIFDFWVWFLSFRSNIKVFN